MRPIIRSGLALLVVALVGLAGPAWSVGGAPEATIKSVELRARTPTMTSECPKAVDFQGSIEVSGPCQVDYRFVRSDGVASRVQRLTFTAAGRQAVAYSWTLNASTRGWVAAEAAIAPARITTPAFPPSAPVRSANAEFNLTCRPTITDVKLIFNEYGDYVAVEILGRNFGPPSSTRSVYKDGAQASLHELNSWTDTRIEFDEEVFRDTPAWLQWWDHVYQWTIAEGGAVISNVFTNRFRLHLHMVTPSSGSMDTPIEIRGDGLSHPGDLKIGPHLVTNVTLREMHRIRAVVPSTVGPGTYQLSIVQGGVTISDTIPFTVR